MVLVNPQAVRIYHRGAGQLKRSSIGRAVLMLGRNKGNKGPGKELVARD